jgi:SAM-dependent MidA family methyltransferase
VTERLDAFMARANATYYATHDPFADFTTAPEISQVFGEIMGLWAAVAWDLLGRPSPVMLAEAGPGRGTLMVDALRAIGGAMPAFRAALRLHLIETSPRLRAIQAHVLPDAAWHESLAGLPEGPLLLLGNEFLDALPIRQFVRCDSGWAERYVGEQGWVEIEVTEPLLPLLLREWGGRRRPAGTVVEHCEPALSIAAALAHRFVHEPGAALFLDYGPEHSAPGDSLQAIAAGKPAEPLSPPGTADLTAHVDFAAFAAVAREAGAVVHGPAPQGLFLARLGLFQRTNRLARNLPPARAGAMIQAAQRLAEPDRMGRLFKALAICSPGCPGLPGFAD